MSTIDTRWFDVAVVMTIFAIGGILFGRFEEHKPRYRRLLKVVVLLALIMAVAQTFGRAAAYGLLAIRRSSQLMCTSSGCRSTASTGGRPSPATSTWHWFPLPAAAEAFRAEERDHFVRPETRLG